MQSKGLFVAIGALVALATAEPVQPYRRQTNLNEADGGVVMDSGAVETGSPAVQEPEDAEQAVEPTSIAGSYNTGSPAVGQAKPSATTIVFPTDWDFGNRACKMYCIPCKPFICDSEAPYPAPTHTETVTVTVTEVSTTKSTETQTTTATETRNITQTTKEYVTKTSIETVTTSTPYTTTTEYSCVLPGETLHPPAWSPSWRPGLPGTIIPTIMGPTITLPPARRPGRRPVGDDDNTEPLGEAADDGIAQRAVEEDQAFRGRPTKGSDDKLCNTVTRTLYSTWVRYVVRYTTQVLVKTKTATTTATETTTTEKIVEVPTTIEIVNSTTVTMTDVSTFTSPTTVIVDHTQTNTEYVEVVKTYTTTTVYTTTDTTVSISYSTQTSTITTPTTTTATEIETETETETETKTEITTTRIFITETTVSPTTLTTTLTEISTVVSDHPVISTVVTTFVSQVTITNIRSVEIPITTTVNAPPVTQTLEVTLPPQTITRTADGVASTLTLTQSTASATITLPGRLIISTVTTCLLPQTSRAAFDPRSDLTWGCRPGSVCSPLKVEGCNVYVDMPPDDYVCQPHECIAAPDANPVMWQKDNETDYYPPVDGYFNLDPRAFGLSPEIFEKPKVVTTVIDGYETVTTLSDSMFVSRSTITAYPPESPMAAAPTPYIDPDDAISEKRNHAARALADVAKRHLHPLSKRDETIIPSVCYDECNSCAIEAQKVGKSARICSDGSDFRKKKDLCDECIAEWEPKTQPTNKQYLDSKLHQYLAFCNLLPAEPGGSGNGGPAPGVTGGSPDLRTGPQGGVNTNTAPVVIGTGRPAAGGSPGSSGSSGSPGGSGSAGSGSGSDAVGGGAGSGSGTGSAASPKPVTTAGAGWLAPSFVTLLAAILALFMFTFFP